MAHTHYTRHGHKHPVTLFQKFNLVVVIPVVLILVSALILGFHFSRLSGVPWGTLIAASGATLLRMFLAYLAAVIIAVPLALWTQTSRRAEQFLLPVFDVLESVPVLVFFPVVIVFFIKLNFLTLAAIFVMFVSMLWTIVFNVISGYKAIPQDLFSVAHVFKIKGWRYYFEIVLPALFPSVIVGSLLAWAGGWNIIIVAEVLHTYVSSPVRDLFGIGSILVNASAGNDRSLFIGAVIVIVATIALLNLVIWQKLLGLGERFKFE